MQHAQQQATLQWVETDSSNVKSVVYDEPTGILGVRFHNGGLYSYANVGLEVYSGLAGAVSVGKYLNTVIKGVYPYTLHPSESDLAEHIARHRSK